ncbi:MAG: SusC/RagA family TonB-linked outer membrane protein [Bacteroidales bacterium]|nr:SusC/RagA family TonB-linked outer membrane protein [Bacteroidales bacterium]
MKKVLLLGLLMFTTLAMSAQNVVKGVVTAGDDGLPMVGVSVFEKGTLNGVITDPDGNYSIKVQNNKSVLVFSSVGFKTTEVPVAGKTVIDVTLDVDSQLIDEVVVMGYSSKTRGEITSAVTTVSADKLNDVVSNNIGDMLQGKVAGVTVVKDSGRPGAEPSIRIRGTSSLHASQEPLYVVDGIIGGSYDPADVESVTVLKDAGATGMYGAQANGGVIVVTTKKAKTNKLQFNFKANIGVISPDFSRQRLMNTKQLYTYYREYFRDPETHLIDDLAFKTALPASILENDTDWRGLITQNALLQNYHFSVMGRNDWYSGYLSFSYYKEQGTLKNTGYTQFNVRSNNTINLTKWLTLTANLDVSGNMSDNPDDNLVYYVGENIPFDSPYDEDGNLRSFKDGAKLYGRYDVNPMIGFLSDKDVRKSKGFGTDLDFVVTAKITPWLSFVSQNRGSVGFWHSHYHRFAEVEYMNAGDKIEDSMSYSYGGISTNMFKADKTFGKHSVSGLIGYEAQMTWGNDLSGSGQGLPYGLSVLDVASSNKDAGGNRSKSGMQSFISQVNYNYAQRYFLTGSFRIDQSSTFNKDNRTAIFPSLSAAWAVNNESFFHSDIITNLKLKASWGKTGMKDIGASKYLEAFAYSTQYDSNSAAVPIQMANKDLKWEETTQINVGAEVGITDRISLDINYYRNTTNNLLVYRDLPPTGGFSSQWQNLGSVRNTGFELALNVTPVKTKDLRWDVDFSISNNKNKLFGFGEGVQFIQSNYRSLSQIYRDGVPIYTWYLREYAGVDPQTGKEQFVAEDGSLTYDYASARFVEAGTPIIPWQGGVGTQVSWKNFKLTANGSFVWGNTLYGRARASRLATFVSNSLMPSNEDKIWRKPGDDATIGLPAYALASVYHTGDLVKGNFFKLRNVTLSYTLPKSITKDNTLTLSLSCDNLFTLTSVWGADPEVSLSADSGVAGMIESIDNRYPNKKQFIFQVNFSF